MKHWVNKKIVWPNSICFLYDFDTVLYETPPCCYILYKDFWYFFLKILENPGLSCIGRHSQSIHIYMVKHTSHFLERMKRIKIPKWFFVCYFLENSINSVLFGPNYGQKREIVAHFQKVIKKTVVNSK